MKKFLWLGVTLAGCAVSLYGNKKVHQAVREEQKQKIEQDPSIPKPLFYLEVK